MYRLAMKWGWFQGRDPDATRAKLKKLKWAITAFFLAIGLLTLVAYIKIGIEHAGRSLRADLLAIGQIADRGIPAWEDSLAPADLPAGIEED